MNPAARQVALLNAQAAAWEHAPPTQQILVAGTTAGIPAVARLLRVVARLPNGPRAAARRRHHDGRGHLEPARRLASASRPAPPAGRPRRDPRRPAPLAGPAAIPGAARALRHAQPRPAARRRRCTPGGATRRRRCDGISRLTPADQQEEAAAIALVLRDALETPGARAALVTPDRELAGRVAAELLRHGVVADDSAGEPLADTPARRVPAPAHPRRRRGTGAGPLARPAEAPAGRRRSVPRRLPRRRPGAGAMPACAVRARRTA